MKTITNSYRKAFIYIFCLSILLIANILWAQENKNLPPKRFVLMVNSIIPDAPAEKAGIAVGDIIYSLNHRLFYDKETTSLAEEFVIYLKSLPSGDHNLVILRKGEKIKVSIKLPPSSTSPRLGISMEVLENDPQIYFDKAIDALKRATTRDDLRKVVNLFEKTKALSPTWPDVYHNLGLIYEKLDYYDKAAENFTEYLRYALRENSPDVENIAMAINRNKRKYEVLESVKSKMVYSTWILIKQVPPGKIGVSIKKFKLDKSGRIWMMNPLTELTETKIEGSLQAIVERNIREHPMFPVEFDGRFFEIRSFYIWIIEHKLPTGLWQKFFYPVYEMYRGEIDLDSSFPIIKIRYFSKNRDDEKYNSFDEALNKTFQKLKEYKFDEMEDFKYELHYRLE